MSGIGQTIDSILALQPSYSSSNTPEMQERGRLIRNELSAHVRDLGPQLATALSEYGDDFSVGSSDGIGRKTEAPWVRFHSQRMAPTPRDGFYTVIHFSADGSAFWITVGCGSTLWRNGDLKELPPSELLRRTQWARSVVTDAFGSLSPFNDQITLGTKASLPRTFERATALAQRFVPGTHDDEIEQALVTAASFLAAIYRAQRVGADLPQADVVQLEIEAILKPGRAKGQAFGLTAPERSAVEVRAMTLATEWLKTEGFQVKDVSRNSSFDLLATAGGQTLKVEVKGTTASSCDAIFMTKNEVDLHRKEQGETALILVPGIKLKRTEDGPSASGGQVEALMGWAIDDWTAEAISYRLNRQPKL